MQITGANLQQFFQAVDFAFKGAAFGTPTFWKMFTKEVPSRTEKNVYPWLSEIPSLREWLGPRIVENIATRDYSLTNKHFERTIGIDRVKVEDDQYGFFTDVASSLGKVVAEFNDVKVAETIEAGNSALCWDGQYFFDTDHPVDVDSSAAGTYSNNLVGAAYDLSADPKGAFGAARKAMMKFKRDDGRPMGLTPNILMVPPDLEDAGMVAIEAGLISQKIMNVAANENVANAAVSNVYQGKATLIVNPHLTVTNAAYVFCTTKGIMPFLFQNRQAPNFVPRVDPASDNVFNLRRFEWGVDLRAAYGYTFPFLGVRIAAS
jgi:phage major head subunit gpT-like protein